MGVMMLLEACSTNKYVVTDYLYNQNKITVKKSAFIIVKNDKQVPLKFITVKPDNVAFPIVIYKVTETDYKALFLQCSHQGCELSPYETTMVCPCHGAEFNTKGEVTQGPAEDNLKTFITTHDTENIYIQL